jgi:diguanylate cyclase (GGDEF)-like protein
MVRVPSPLTDTLPALGSDDLQKNGHKLLRRLLAENLSLARELEKLRLLRRLALPGVRKGPRNRRLFAQRLTEELARSGRNTTSQGSLLLMVVNDLKLVNDRHGREAGEFVLREIIDVTRAALETPDVLCRTGGTELMVLLPEADAGDARLMMAKLRAAVIRTGARRDLSISVSIVSASWPADGVAVAALCREAERAMELEQRTLRGRARRRRSPVNGGKLALVVS